MLKAQDIMTRNVISVTPETRIEDLARLFVEKRVSAMPVITKEGRLTGVISETDLVEQNKPLHVPTVISLFDWVLYLESEKDFQEEVEQITARTVSEICSDEVVFCDPQTTLSEIASLMSDHKVNLIPVVDDDKVVGVVARLDLVRAMGR
ncbi:MAG: CBS domain-containing protein [Desulfuromonadales bacterium]